MTSEKLPLVSIGLPVYNGENYIEEAIDSILNQSYRNIELIICDNASNDNTIKICKEYCKKDKRIKLYLNGENLGAARNYNRTLELSSGKYFKWAAHDDYTSEDYIEKCVNQLERDSDIHLCNTYRKFIKDDHETFRWDKFSQIDFLSPSIKKRYLTFLKNFRFREPDADVVLGVFRREILDQTQKIANFHSSDLTLVAEIILQGKIYIIDEFLFFRRFHKDMSIFANTSKNNRAKWFNPKKKHILTPIPFLIWFTQFVKFVLKSKDLNFVNKMVLVWGTINWLLARIYSRLMIKFKLRKPSDFGYYSLNI